MEYIWLTLSIICALVGLLGAVLPAIPGSPVSYAALWLLWLYDSSCISITTLVVMGIFMLLVTILDFVAPIWLTRHGGGTKQGERGATIGLILGLFLGPWGIILGPFFGALIGELIAKTPHEKAIKVAFMSFIGFILTTGIKLIYGLSVIFIGVKVTWDLIF